jgi:hypothetical protein
MKNSKYYDLMKGIMTDEEIRQRIKDAKESVKNYIKQQSKIKTISKKSAENKMRLWNHFIYSRPSVNRKYVIVTLYENKDAKHIFQEEFKYKINF